MACRIYCGTPTSEIGMHLTDGYITIYGDSYNNTVTKEFISACARCVPTIHSISLEGIIAIGERAFQGLGAISNVSMYLPDTIVNIGDYAFSEIGSINTIEIPSSVTDEGFGKYVFYKCTSLKTVIFRTPTELTTIPKGTFQRCSALNAVKLSSTTESHLTEFPNTFKTISDYAFAGCTSLGHTMIIPDSVEYLGAYAFSNCGSLQNVTLGKGLNTTYEEEFEPLPDNTTQNLTICSHRQFRYQKDIVALSTDNYKLELNDEFKYCTYQSHYMIFHNRRLVPMSSIVAHSISETPIDKPVLYLNIPVAIRDVIEVFYVSNDMRSLNSNIENSIEAVNSNNQPIDKIQNSGYIRFESPLYMISNKHSLFVFLNGKKIPMSSMEDISDTIIKITTNQESCERLEILNHIDNEAINDKVFIKDGLSHEISKIKTIDIGTFQTYENPCKLDMLVNPSSDEQLNLLFDTTSRVTGSVPVVDGDYVSRNTILNRILEDYVISGDPGDWIANVI